MRIPCQRLLITVTTTLVWFNCNLCRGSGGIAPGYTVLELDLNYESSELTDMQGNSEFEQEGVVTSINLAFKFPIIDSLLILALNQYDIGPVMHGALEVSRSNNIQSKRNN